MAQSGHWDPAIPLQRVRATQYDRLVLSLGVAMRRRDFIKVVGGGAAVWPLAARAQPTIPVVGYLADGSPKGDERLTAALFKGLGETGYEKGKNVQVEYRWAENKYEQNCHRWRPIWSVKRWP